ncbi:hypothetical protein LSAT2_028847 [Lamellibrachia satsuma]|nr:hypothetical protein LSAT2_028847 [Lamellibrachia satsuma]
MFDGELEIPNARYLADKEAPSPLLSLLEDTQDAEKRAYRTQWRRLNSRGRVGRNSICCRKGRCCKRRFRCTFVPRLRDFYCIP